MGQMRKIVQADPSISIKMKAIMNLNRKTIPSIFIIDLSIAKTSLLIHFQLDDAPCDSLLSAETF